MKVHSVVKTVQGWARLLRRRESRADDWVPGLGGEVDNELLDHRQYVGGLWEEIGKLQFEFLLRQGLQPSDCLLDVACGSLRGGVHFINYLEPGNYLGIEKQPSLVALGVEKELGRAVFKRKRPEFVISGDFEFRRFSKKPKYAIAQSLLTHLTPADIQTCLRNLREFVKDGHVFFATFFEGDSSNNPRESHPHECFFYSIKAMEDFGERVGWRPKYMGDWSHPRGQVMMRFEAA
jgi:hypothetical protein